MDNLINKVNSAKVILVPKGDDSQPCLKAFKEATGISVPEFNGRKLQAKASSKTFIKVKGKDIPALIAAGYGEVGLTGSDSCDEFLTINSGISYKPFNTPMCRFSLLAPKAKASQILKQIESKLNFLEVATSFPYLLNKCAQDKGIKLLPAQITVAGSVEIMPSLLNVPLVADLVASGETAKANGLVEIINLTDVYPALVIKDDSAFDKPKQIKSADIIRIDETISQRSMQTNNPAYDSYSLTLIRDKNKAGKKAGEEFSEAIIAIFGGGSINDCENEIADVIYSQIVASYSCQKNVKLSNIINILITRNQKGTNL